MPTTPIEIFKHVGLEIQGQVKWNYAIPVDKCGLYVVALTDKSNIIKCNDIPFFSDLAFDNWLLTVKSGNKNILIDNKPADRNSLKQRLMEFWLPDETIVYIGKAGPNKRRTLKKRVDEYYDTKLGSNKRHAGGHWINVLQNVNDLTVYYCEYTEKDIEEKEEEMILYFMDNVSDSTKALLRDKINCYPFANKEIHKHSIRSKIKKDHGLNNQAIYCGQDWKK
jgi:hypothetical protein